MDYNLVITLTNGVEHEFMISIPDGVDGASFQAKGSVVTKKDLPDVATAEIGDSYIVEGGPESEAGHLYILGTEKVSETATPHLAWIDMGRIVGRDGKDGTVADFDQNQFTTKVVDGKTVITIKNDPDSSNQLSVIGKEGLFVRPASAQVRAKDKSVRVAGIPQDKNGGFNTEVSVNLDPGQSSTPNTIQLTEKGLLGILQSSVALGSDAAMASGVTTPEEWKAFVEARLKNIKNPGEIVYWNYNDEKYFMLAEWFTAAQFSKVYYVRRALYEYPSESGKRRALVVADTMRGPIKLTVVYDEPVFTGESSGNPFVSIQPGYQTNIPAKSKVSSSIAIGESSEVDGNSAIVIGARAKGKGDRNIVIGENANGNGSGQILIGSGVKDTWNNIIIGTNGSAKSGNAVLVGHGTKGAQRAIAIGASARAEFEQAITIGAESVANVDEGVVVGPHAMVSHKGSAAFGAGSLTSRENTVSFGTPSHVRILENVADGVQPYDAVNVNQLSGVSLKRYITGGTFSWNYNDNPKQAESAGKIGNGCYLMATMTLYNDLAMRDRSITNLELTSIPCREDGTMIPYSLSTDYVRNTGGVAKLKVILVMQEIPTHTLDLSTMTTTLVARGDNGLPVGIPEIPIRTPETSAVGNEIGYRFTYFADVRDTVAPTS